MLPYPDAVFDKAFCCGLIYYLPDPVKALHEAARVLNPGGVLVVMARQPRALVQNPVFAQANYRSYCAEELVDLLDQAGFGETWCEQNPPDETVLAVVGKKHRTRPSFPVSACTETGKA